MSGLLRRIRRSRRNTPDMSGLLGSACPRVPGPARPTRAHAFSRVIPNRAVAEDSGVVTETATRPRSMSVPLAAFAAGAVVAVLVGVFGKVHDPTTNGTTTLWFRTVIDMKVVLSTVVGVLVLLQLL